MSGTFQIGAILAAGGGFDFFTLIGVSIFFLLSFVAKRAQRAAEEKARREEEGSDSVPVQQAQEAKPKRQDFWGALEEQLREIMGEPIQPKAPRQEITQSELEALLTDQRAEIPPQRPPSRKDDSSGTAVLETPVLKREIDVRKIAAAPKARGVGQVRRDLKSELSQLKIKVSEHVRGLGVEENALPIGSVRASRMESEDVPAYRLSRNLKSPGSLQDYIVISTVLGPPKALSTEGDLYEKY